MAQIPLIATEPSADLTPTLAYLTVVIPPLDGEYLYSYDTTLSTNFKVGDVVQVPLGKRTTYGFVISNDSERERSALEQIGTRGVKIKKIAPEALTAHAFHPEHLEFYEWIARYYAEPLSKILDLAIPTPAPDKPKPAYTLNPTSPLTPESTPKPGSIQAAVIELLSASNTPIDAKTLQDQCKASPAVIRALLKKELIKQSLLQTTPPPTSEPEKEIKPPLLNEQQQAAVNQIRPGVGTFNTTLLHGVTGSGKTEVYLTLIIEALARGESALVVVPEIALTPQLTERFISRLQLPVAVLHSSLKPKERWKHWSDLAAGRVRVAIGARSAIFAPLRNLGVIVVDEEHDSSFKQGEGIRYHARDLALVRAKINSCPVILGSATPSLETYHNAKSGRYRYLTLQQRYHDAADSSFEIIDLNQIKPWLMKSKSISPRLYTVLNNTLESGGQAFVLYNRRGFASYLQCSSCEHVVGCPHCSVTLTYHRATHSLLCHQCNFAMVPPGVCMGCGANEGIGEREEPLFAHRGAGTERVHEELATILPKARIATLDRDTASSITDYIEILRKVREREVDILVGTQMIAKGHDLPGVTCVGIVDCDVGLHIPDFRAAERSFQLLTQVAGRAGRRSKAGTVILQTRVPRHPSLLMTAASNYLDFADQELQLRGQLGYPPFRKLLRIIISCAERSTALQHATTIARMAREIAGQRSIDILGPAPAPIERIRTLWRYHILVKSNSGAELQHLMKLIKHNHRPTQDTRIAYDLDPHDML